MNKLIASLILTCLVASIFTQDCTFVRNLKRSDPPSTYCIHFCLKNQFLDQWFKGFCGEPGKCEDLGFHNVESTSSRTLGPYGTYEMTTYVLGNFLFLEETHSSIESWVH